MDVDAAGVADNTASQHARHPADTRTNIKDYSDIDAFQREVVQLVHASGIDLYSSGECLAKD